MLAAAAELAASPGAGVEAGVAVEAAGAPVEATPAGWEAIVAAAVMVARVAATWVEARVADAARCSPPGQAPGSSSGSDSYPTEAHKRPLSWRKPSVVSLISWAVGPPLPGSSRIVTSAAKQPGFRQATFTLLRVGAWADGSRLPRASHEHEDRLLRRTHAPALQCPAGTAEVEDKHHRAPSRDSAGAAAAEATAAAAVLPGAGAVEAKAVAVEAGWVSAAAAAAAEMGTAVAMVAVAALPVAK
ncbi:hypothetical protein EMIHUDRAFT_108954 [Emiliania huxleyi CCMP1516]|uniref:Uncharacterized protein n=2 Tax=Emiliania huxleyi TaxID=2903 RepID=A0A0D3IM40_EMIH1|nr:hypothetical protein EMIHUDRAFT_104208 [Emiliania huxleyi CCMP1516]XP_005791624.1 hypothetical protein EMIHUDRAFT_108954 [Emiliania huxleyi CCMP1516]EOD12325.1 hypothetical protein EMIHUDRAFT_104208 [Emiliania huxleyi CCMP1516]EOD39195.1 hypothetical protein EMIHUDRAFT_108954 [Emiliania huxleyi CCMP1516]|eukprot:XP_005764754.1 hypothetical protein EMIHUDRAFT_104208 [Emiliania huxleyi CCMP1516]